MKNNLNQISFSVGVRTTKDWINLYFERIHVKMSREAFDGGVPEE